MLRLVLTLTLVAACKTEPGDDTGGATGSTTAPNPASTSTAGADTSTSGAPTTEPTTTSASGSSGTTGEPASTGGTTTDGTTGGDADPACMNYCTELMAACSGANLQYSSLESCLGVCGTFPQGMVGDVTGNSLACRLYHTGAAAEDADTHCVHAGPGGADFCGTNCESFCAIATSICPTEHPTNEGCLAQCAGYSDAEKYDASDVNGDTLACRLYHLTVAAVDDQMALVHCPHTLAASPPCM